MADRTQAQTARTPLAVLDQEASESKRLFTLEEYRKMAEAGIFTEDDRVELVEGEIVQMTPIGARHVRVVNNLTDLLADYREANGYTISVQNPLVLADYAEYQPDVTLLSVDRDRNSLPSVADTLLVIEVAQSSLSYDRNVKLPLYAKSGAPEAWLVDLVSERIEVHSDPREGAGGYGRVERFGRGERLRSATLSQLTLPVDGILFA